MKADKMFEELGYTRTIEPNEPCNMYYYADIICKDEFICFDLTRKNFRKVCAYHDSDDITIEELQAINQKVKELGWV